jgi:hypothetical protein
MTAFNPSPLSADADARLPAAAYLRYETRADGWSAGRQAAFLSHLADHGVVDDAAACVGKHVSGAYALRRTARGYVFNLGWEAALIIARRIVADRLMAAAIKGEVATWVREEGKTTYTRQNSRLSVALLDRVNPATTLPEVMAVASHFDWFLELIDKGASAGDHWELFFESTLPHDQGEARERVRASLLLTEESAHFEEDDPGAPGAESDDGPVEYKSMDGPVLATRNQGESLSADQLHQLALDGREHGAQFVPAFQDRTGFADERPHPLPVAQFGAFFDAIFGAFGGAAEGAEDGSVTAEVDGIIAPVARRDHAAVKVENARQFVALKADLTGFAGYRKRRYDRAQPAFAPFTPAFAGARRLAGAGTTAAAAASRSAISSATFLRSVSISHCMISRLCVAGSNISRQGVPYGMKSRAYVSALTSVERALTPIIVAPAGTSSVTTAAAPMRARSPIVIGPNICAPEPIMTLSKMVGWRLPAAPLAGLVPPSVTFWYIVTLSPISAVSPMTLKPWSTKKLRPIFAPGWISIPVTSREKWLTSRARKNIPPI